MKKHCYLNAQVSFACFIFSLFFITSCKKNESSLSEKQQLSLLASKYNLTEVSNPTNKATREFNTVAEFETFLQNNSRNLASKTLQLKSTAKAVIMPKMGQRNLDQSAASDDDPGGSVNSGPDSPYYSTVSYSVIFSFPELGSAGYPNVVILGWTAIYPNPNPITNVINITSKMYVTGSNFGTWSYSQNLGNAPGYDTTGGIINAQGTYSETYGVGGIYTYTRLFIFQISANFNRSAGTASAQASFSPM